MFGSGRGNTNGNGVNDGDNPKPDPKKLPKKKVAKTAAKEARDHISKGALKTVEADSLLQQLTQNGVQLDNTLVANLFFGFRFESCIIIILGLTILYIYLYLYPLNYKP